MSGDWGVEKRTLKQEESTLIAGYLLKKGNGAASYKRNISSANGLKDKQPDVVSITVGRRWVVRLIVGMVLLPMLRLLVPHPRRKKPWRMNKSGRKL